MDTLASRSCAFLFRLQKLALTMLGVILAGVFAATTLSASVNSGEILPSSVTATLSTTFDPINGYSVTFRWTTVHPGNSIVVIEDPDDYRSNNNYPNRRIVQNDYVTNHTVVVDHFPAYAYSPTWGYYVASQQASGSIRGALTLDLACGSRAEPGRPILGRLRVLATPSTFPAVAARTSHSPCPPPPPTQTAPWLLRCGPSGA